MDIQLSMSVATGTPLPLLLPAQAGGLPPVYAGESRPLAPYLDPMEAPQVMAGFVGPLMVGAAAGWPADTTPVEGGYSVQGERLTSTLETDIRISAA